MNVVPCTDSAVQRNDWVDSNGKNAKSTFCRAIILVDMVVSFYRSISLRSYSGLKISATNLRLLKKTTPYGEIFKILFRKDSPPHRSTSCVQILWNLADGKSVKSCVIYLTKKQNIASLSRSRFYRIAPKICQGQRQTIFSRVPQISSKSVHFRRSYSRTCEHDWNSQ